MKEIEQIKMRKDIVILTNQYKISVNSLAKEFELPENTLREFIFEPQINLSDKNFVKTKNALEKIIRQIKIAQKYKGFNEEYKTFHG